MTDEEWLQLGQLYRKALEEMMSEPRWRVLYDRGDLWIVHDALRERINQRIRI